MRFLVWAAALLLPLAAHAQRYEVSFSGTAQYNASRSFADDSEVVAMFGNVVGFSGSFYVDRGIYDLSRDVWIDYLGGPISLIVDGVTIPITGHPVADFLVANNPDGRYALIDYFTTQDGEPPATGFYGRPTIMFLPEAGAFNGYDLPDLDGAPISPFSDVMVGTADGFAIYDNLVLTSLVITGSQPPIGETPPVSPVPEPAAWAMLIGGFGIAGGALRRRRVSVRYA